MLVTVTLTALVLLFAIASARRPRTRRRRSRRLLFLLALEIVLALASYALAKAGLPLWSSRIRLGAQLVESLIAIDLVAGLLFELALPVLSITVAPIVGDIFVGVAYAVTAGVVLSDFGLNATNVVATSAILGTVVSFSLQNTLQNVFGGVALQIDGTAHVGDWISLGGESRVDHPLEGRIRSIRWRHAVLETRDGDTVIVPNDLLLRSQVIIAGKAGPMGNELDHLDVLPRQRRLQVQFQVDLAVSPIEVISVVETALFDAAISGLAAGPPPDCLVVDYARPGLGGATLFAVRFWITDMTRDQLIASYVRVRIHTALQRAGIMLARPAENIVLDSRENAEPRHPSVEVRSDVLRQVELFAHLREDERRALAEELYFAPFAAGELVSRQGATAHFLYILAKGSVEVLLRAPAGKTSRLVTCIEAPGFFGEMGLLTGQPRTADVRAASDVQCFRLEKKAFASVLKARPEIAEHLADVLARRREELDTALSGLDASLRAGRQEGEAHRILRKIVEFFGLEGGS